VRAGARSASAASTSASRSPGPAAAASAGTNASTAHGSWWKSAAVALVGGVHPIGSCRMRAPGQRARPLDQRVVELDAGRIRPGGNGRGDDLSGLAAEVDEEIARTERQQIGHRRGGGRAERHERGEHLHRTQVAVDPRRMHVAGGRKRPGGIDWHRIPAGRDRASPPAEG